MKILQVVHSLSFGGAEKLSCDLALTLKPKYEFEIACLDKEGPLKTVLQENGILSFCFWRRPGFDFSVAKNLARLYQSHDIDVVHAHQYAPFFYSVLGKSLSKKKPILIFTEHGRHQPDKVSLKHILFNRLILSNVNHITGVSQFSKESLAKYEWIPFDRIQVIYNGVRENPVQYLESPSRESLGVAADAILVGCIGRFHRVKGQETLTKAFSQVARDFPKARLIYVGSGELLEENKNMAELLGISSQVIFLGDRRDASGIMRILDVVVIPSISEACSLTLLDAMLSRRAIVATQTGGNPEILGEEGSALQVPPGDSKAMADAISDLLKHDEKRKMMGGRAFQRVIRHYKYDDMVAAYERLYLGPHR